MATTWSSTSAHVRTPAGRWAWRAAPTSGITQYLAAEQRPPHLAAITPAVAISDLYREGFAHGGIPSLSFDAQYIAVQGAPGAAGANTDPLLLDQTLRAKLGQSPPGTIAFDYLERPNDDRFYRDRSPIYRAEAIQVPTLIVGGWRDGLLRGAPEMYQRLSRRRGVETRLYIDPCTPQGLRRAVRAVHRPARARGPAAVLFEFLDKHLRGARRPTAPARALLPPGQERFVDAEPVAARRRPARGGSGWGRARARTSPTRRRVQPRVQQVRHGGGNPVRADRPASRGPAGHHLPHPGAGARARRGGTDRAAPGSRVHRRRHRLAREAVRRGAGRQRDARHRGRAARVAPRARPPPEHGRFAPTTRTPTRGRSRPAGSTPTTWRSSPPHTGSPRATGSS